MKYEALFSAMNQLVTLSEDDKTKIKAAFQYKQYSKKEVLVQNGEVCNYVRFILSGYLKKIQLTENGDEKVLLLYAPGFWCAVIESFTERTPSDYVVCTITEVEVLQISYEKLQNLYKDCPAVNSFFRRLAEKGLSITHKRIIIDLHSSAKEKYIAFKKTYPEIDEHIPQYLIASYLGVSKAFFSRLKQQIAKENE